MLQEVPGMGKLWWVLLLSLAMTCGARAADPLPACVSAEQRQMDFWIGHWIVRDTVSGVAIGKSRIESMLGGCAVSEAFAQDVGPGNRPVEYRGVSYSAYDSASGTWRQFYVDSGGNSSLWSGRFDAGAMMLETSGKAVSRRMTLRIMPDGDVRQIGEATHDGGKTWQQGYDFTYEREAGNGSAH
jgi:hypothetical protein